MSPRRVDPSVALGPSDRLPELSDLVRADDLRRALEAFLSGSVDGVALFGRDGAAYAKATLPSSPIAGWEQLPPEANAEVRRSGTPSFGLGDHVFDVRAAYAGTERVGILVVSRGSGEDSQGEADLADALTGMVAPVLQSGFATWVTSELHMAASESSHRALTQQNAELERAVAHLREIDKLKSNFLATVSHELRTPLTSVIGFSDLLLEGLAGELNNEQAEYVRTILTRGEELLGLITRVLEMSQLEVGAIRLDLGTHKIDAIAKQAAANMELAASQGEISVNVEVPELPDALVDEEKLQRILMNLIGNAIKFTKPGGSVRVTAARAPIRRPFQEETLFGEEADDAIRVSVADTGVGIPPEQLGRIFEAFYQVDGSTTREHGGAGLGLSIVRSLVAAHGGEVWVDSEVGVGTTVHFTVPAAADPSATATPAAGR